MTRILLFCNDRILSLFESEDDLDDFIKKINIELDLISGQACHGVWLAQQHGDLIILNAISSPPIKPVRIKRPHLNRQEKIILQGLVDGKSIKEIASRLNLSSRSVMAYLANLKVKFSAHTRDQTVGRAVALGLCLVNIFNDDNVPKSR